MALIAKRPILYGRMYKPGEALPGTDPKMVEAWLRYGSAENTAAKQEPEQEGGTLDIVEGHMTRESLATMPKANLEKLAKDMGVEVPKGATKDQIIAQLATEAVEVHSSEGGVR